MIILDSGRVIDPSSKLDGTRTVVIDGERVKEVREHPATPAEKLVHQVVDCRGLWILPGLVDRASFPPAPSRAAARAKLSPTWPS